jgi:hypothetical protein
MGRAAPKFRFKRLDNIGAADAEEDKSFLEHCFVDIGDLAALRDCENPQRIILGRTGSGKSALLLRLKDIEPRCIEVRPESLSLAYISNSTILRFFENLGVKLDIFFRLLWRHVFTVEILKFHFNIDTEEAKESFLERLKDLFRDKKHAQAIEYLKKWGASFWEETEYRIKEVTRKLETDLKAAVQAKVPISSFTVGAAEKLSEEQKQDVVDRAQHVVNDVQIRQLSDILDLINDVLKDKQKRYYIVIDRLDEDWIEERLRLRLIRALIETAKDFGKIRQAKIVLALRLDLLDRVFRLTRDAGFQEEKYESLYLPLEWNKTQLIEVLETRINFLIERHYSKQKVSYSDVLPKKVGQSSPLDYILERTMMRPRDVILFFNCCIQKAADLPMITAQMIREAEGDYSYNRLRSLADEWSSDYPTVLDFISLLRARPKHFPITDITDEEIADCCLQREITGQKPRDIISVAAREVVNELMNINEFRKIIFQVFYRVGLVGLKLQPSEPFRFLSSKRRMIAKSEIGDNARAEIHPAFWRVLGTKLQ